VASTSTQFLATISHFPTPHQTNYKHIRINFNRTNKKNSILTHETKHTLNEIILSLSYICNLQDFPSTKT